MQYKLFKDVIPYDILEYLREYTLYAKQVVKPYEGQFKPIGSGKYWKGIDMASSLPLVSDEENQKLFDIFTSKFMYDIVTSIMPIPYLFNDQIVVKEAREEFVFGEHYDNQYGPYPNDPFLVTMNFMLVLDNFTKENGAIRVFDKQREEWIEFLPNAGDILMIEGNTLHASNKNQSDSPRRAYLCVYSNRPIGEGFQEGFYSQRFIV